MTTATPSFSMSPSVVGEHDNIDDLGLMNVLSDISISSTMKGMISKNGNDTGFGGGMIGAASMLSGNSDPLLDHDTEDSGNAMSMMIDEASKKCTSFERFIIRSVERQTKAIGKGGETPNPVLLFSCTEQIGKDYRSIVELYNSISNTNMLNDDQGNTDSNDNDVIDINLHAASHIAQQLIRVLDLLLEAEQCYVKESGEAGQAATAALSHSLLSVRTPIQIVYADIEKFILTQFALLMYDMNSLNVIQCSKLLCWYENFTCNVIETIVHDYSQPKLKISAQWNNDSKRLLDRYLEYGVRNEMIDLIKWTDKSLLDYSDEDFTVIVSTADPDTTDTPASSYLVTNLPEEIVYLYENQLNRALDNLPESYVTIVIETFYNVVVDEILRNKIHQINYATTNIRTIVYCAVINDAIRLRRLLMDRDDNFFITYGTMNEQDSSSNSSNPRMASLKKAADDASKVLLDLQQLAVESLSTSLYFKLNLLLKKNVGTRAWELDQTGVGITQIIVTIVDHYNSIEKYILNVEQLIPLRISIQESLTYIVRTYIETFFMNTMCHGIQDCALVSRNLHYDYLSFQEFVNSSIITRHGVNKTISESDSSFHPTTDLDSSNHLIQILSQIMDPDIAPTALIADIATMMERINIALARGSASDVEERYDVFANNYTKIVSVVPILHLAGLRGQLTKQQSIEWIRAIATAQDTVMVELNESSPSSTNATDTSNDKNGLTMIQLPEIIKDSPFVYRVRVTQDDIDEMFGDEDIKMSFVQDMKDMLEEGFQKLVASYLVRKQELMLSNNSSSVRSATKRLSFFG
jgi:hypothetical protein